MGFDARTAVDPLDYTLEPYVEGATGTVPEPTDAALERYFRTLREIVVEAGISELPEDASDAQVARVFVKLPDDAIETMAEKTREAVIELCQGSPSREQIKALPARPKRAFIDWLTSQLGNPTSSTAATSSAPASPNGVTPATS